MAEPLVYYNAKLTHTGIIGYKVFDGCSRRMKKASLLNLKNYTVSNSEAINDLVLLFRNSLNNDSMSKVNDQAVDQLSKEEYTRFLMLTNQTRNLNPAQSRRVRNLCSKLCYYSANRKFSSKKSGTYSFKVSFLTLTAPESAEPRQILKAFDAFLDYLRRTANCVFVWKKELGETNHHLHFHVLVNNFIPYYIVSWKWKRLLIGEGVEWPVNSDGKETNSHYRIEIPKSRKQTSHYISKYLSKAYALPNQYGYISGHSHVLDECKEFSTISEDLPQDELRAIGRKSKKITSEYVSIVCCDLLTMKDIAPHIHAVFEAQYIDFCERISLPQKFFEC